MQTRRIIRWAKKEVEVKIELLTEPCCSKMQEILMGSIFQTSKIYRFNIYTLPKIWEHCPFCGEKIERGLEKEEEISEETL